MWMQKHHSCREIKLSPEQTRDNRRAYADMITCLDLWFYRIINELEKLGMMEKTAIVVTCGHAAILRRHNNALNKFEAKK